MVGSKRLTVVDDAVSVRKASFVKRFILCSTINLKLTPGCGRFRTKPLYRNLQGLFPFKSSQLNQDFILSEIPRNVHEQAQKSMNPGPLDVSTNVALFLTDHLPYDFILNRCLKSP